MPTYDEVRIKEFLDIPNLEDLCFVLQNKVNEKYAHWKLAGETPADKSRNLVTQASTNGQLADLVFHLANWWFDEFHASKEIFLQAGMHEELLIAARELWTVENRHDQAVQAFDRLANIHKSFGKQWKEFGNVVAHLPNIIDVAQVGFVYDDRLPWFAYDEQLPWGATYPYRLFRELDAPVAPGSSMEQVQDELTRINKQKGISAEQRAILETLLKSEVERLFVDAFLYPACPSRRTVSSIEETFVKSIEVMSIEECQLPTLEMILEQCPEDAAIFLFLLDKPEAAAAIWEKEQRSRPIDGRLAHCLGLLYLGQAHDASAQDHETVVENWRRAFGHWAVALEDTAYWMKWGRRRWQGYGGDFVFASIENLCHRLRDYLRRLLSNHHDRLVEGGDQALAHAMEQLHQELAIEFEAARLWHALGGVVLEPGRLAWFGPLWMTQFGLEEALARHMATVTLDESNANQLLGKLSPSEAPRRLRWYFSCMKKAAILLEGSKPDPEDALETLEQSGYRDAPDRDSPDWDRFATENPAYAGLKDSQTQMYADALYLATDARLQLIRTQTGNNEIIDVDTLRNELQEMLELARSEEDSAAIREQLRVAVLEEIKAAPSSTTRLNALVALVEASLSVLAENKDLKVLLAEMLDKRGEIKLRQGDLSGAEGDLKRALAVAPHEHKIREKLATTWGNLALAILDPSDENSRYVALNYLRQAEELIRTGQAEYPGWNYGELLNWIEDAREKWIGHRQAPSSATDKDKDEDHGTPGDWQLPSPPASDIAKLYAQGVKELHEGHPELALKTFSRALELKPDDVEVQLGAAEALLANATQMIDRDSHEKGLDLVKEWVSRLPTQTKRLERQLEFLERWPHLRRCMRVKDGKYLVHRVRDYQEVLLPFEAKNVESVLIHAQIEEDDLCLTAALPVIPEADAETILENLLLASRDVMLFKVSSYGESDLRLRGLVPFSLLDSEWFLLFAFELSDFADVSRDQLGQIDTLRAYFRETRTSCERMAGSEYQSASGGLVERMCRERNLPFRRLTDFRYEITVSFGTVEMEAWRDGVRLSTRLGQLHKTPSHHTALRRLTELNTELRWSKLALNEDKAIILSVELPYLDEPSAFSAFDLLEQHAGELKPELAK